MTQATAAAFEQYSELNDSDCDSRILAAKDKLRDRAIILGHHYQRADVYKHADLTGDSLKLSKLAGQADASYIVFCGVHFMAEVADILSKPEQVAILPDMAAGCSMADMANLAKVERAWSELSQVLDPAQQVISRHSAVNTAASFAPLRMRARFSNGRLRAVARCCSSRTSIWGAGADIPWAYRRSRCRFGIRTNGWVV